MPRKTSVLDGPLEGPAGASMRPRPDAAENEKLATDHRALQDASMRPRPDAAENRGHLSCRGAR